MGVLQVTIIKDQGGNANAIEIANSSANVTINNLTFNTGFPAGHVLQTVTHTASTSSDATLNAEILNIFGDSSSFVVKLAIGVVKQGFSPHAIVSMTKSGAIDVGGSFGIYATQGGSTRAVYDQTGPLGTYLYLVKMKIGICINKFK